MPSSLRWHKYSHGQQLHKCQTCHHTFMYESKLGKHPQCHVSQKMDHCFFGGCWPKYKHPQDLDHHTATHPRTFSMNVTYVTKTLGKNGYWRGIKLYIKRMLNIIVWSASKDSDITIKYTDNIRFVNKLDVFRHSSVYA